MCLLNNRYFPLFLSWNDQSSHLLHLRLGSKKNPSDREVSTEDIVSFNANTINNLHVNLNLVLYRKFDYVRT